jgi:hypothetical protein
MNRLLAAIGRDARQRSLPMVCLAQIDPGGGDGVTINGRRKMVL